MSLKQLFFPVLLALIFTACGQNDNTQNTSSELTQKTDAIPQLLDRPEAVWHGTEWADIQNRYGTNRQKVATDPTDADAYIKLAEVFINEARITGEHGHYYPAALQMLDEALNQGAEDEDLLFRALATKAGVLLSLHQFPEALAIGQKAVAMNPYNARIYGVLVDAHVEMGDYEQAVQMADRMVSIRPDLRSYSRISYLREIHGDVPGAIEAMEMAVRSGHPAQEETAWAMLTLGELYQNYGQPNKAVPVYEAILEHRPNQPFAIGALGNVYLEKAEFAKAEKYLNQAKDIIPEVGFYIDLATLYQATGREKEAAAMTDEILLMLEDDLASGHNMNLELANVHAHLKNDHKKALEYALTEYKIRPENIDVNRELALLFQDMGEAEKAKIHAEAASVTGSKHPDLMAVAQAISMK